VGSHSLADGFHARACPLCGTPVQRTPDGTLADGMREHCKAVHPGKPVPRG